MHFLLYFGRRLLGGKVKTYSTRAVTVTNWPQVISSPWHLQVSQLRSFKVSLPSSLALKPCCRGISNFTIIVYPSWRSDFSGSFCVVSLFWYVCCCSGACVKCMGTPVRCSRCLQSLWSLLSSFINWFNVWEPPWKVELGMSRPVLQESAKAHVCLSHLDGLQHWKWNFNWAVVPSTI